MLGRARKLLVLLLKLAVTAGLLWWVLAGVRWRDYAVDRAGRSWPVVGRSAGSLTVVGADGARQVRPVGQFEPLDGQVVRPGLLSVLAALRAGWFVLAALLLAGQLTLMGLRWWYLMRFQGLGLGCGETVRLMYVGHFFNFFLPGSTGGDVIRAVLVARRAEARTVAVATVLLDRFAGLAGMALLAGAMMLATASDPRTQRAAAPVAVIVAGIVLAGAVLFSRRVGRAVRLDALLGRLPRGENFRIAIEALRRLPRSGWAVAAVGAMTVSVHLLLAGAVASLGAAVGLPTPVRLYFLFVPVIYILAAVPVSIGGLGVVEGMYVVFFAATAGSGASGVLALALLARLTPMLLSLPGLVFWLGRRGVGRAGGDDGAGG